MCSFFNRGGTVMRNGPIGAICSRQTVMVLVGLVVLLGIVSLASLQDPGSQASQRERRHQMVQEQLRRNGIRDPAVLAAMEKVPRHRFVPPLLREQAYEDGPLPIGHGQTISQPYIVALMTELIVPKKSMRVLEIGTGSGYQAAVLAECVGEVDSIEVVPELGQSAAGLLKELGYRNVQREDRRWLRGLAGPRAVRRHPA